jgi:hypothetical protein
MSSNHPVINVCTFFWRPNKIYRSQFTAEHVNIWARMMRRGYPRAGDVICFTNEEGDFDTSVVTIKKMWPDHCNVPSPWGPTGPSCYRRLKLFGPDAERLVGTKRFVVTDMDCVVTGDLTPLFDRPDDFVIWGDTMRSSYYNGSMMLMSAGARPQVWADFDPVKSPQQVHRMGFKGSDQGWISFKLGRGERLWTTKDGVYSYRLHIRTRGKELPEGARIVFFHGHIDPWHREAAGLSWVRENYR